MDGNQDIMTISYEVIAMATKFQNISKTIFYDGLMTVSTDKIWINKATGGIICGRTNRASLQFVVNDLKDVNDSNEPGRLLNLGDF